MITCEKHEVHCGPVKDEFPLRVLRVESDSRQHSGHQVHKKSNDHQGGTSNDPVCRVKIECHKSLRFS